MKLLDLPVNKDFAKDRAFLLLKYASRFQLAFRDLDLDFEVRFLGTAIKIH